VSSSLDPDETPRKLGGSSGSKLLAYDTLVVLSGLRVNFGHRTCINLRWSDCNVSKAL